MESVTKVVRNRIKQGFFVLHFPTTLLHKLLFCSLSWVKSYKGLTAFSPQENVTKPSLWTESVTENVTGGDYERSNLCSLFEP